MEPNEIRKKYGDLLPIFERIGRSTCDAVTTLVLDAGISFLTIGYRVKSIESLLEKSLRKEYSDPFRENTDFVGIRIVAYYIDDVARIAALLEKEFNVVESINKADVLDVHELGYRSHHCVVTVKDTWLAAPNFRGLGGHAVEIQIRTVLTHAWAEIEHKLRYKSKEQVPKELQRRLYLLSAKFEEADQQFKELRDESQSYRAALTKTVDRSEHFDTSLELNLDTFETFLTFSYPTYPHKKDVGIATFDLVAKNSLSFSELTRFVEDFRPYESRLLQHLPAGLTSPNVLRYALEIVGPLKKGILTSKSLAADRKRIVRDLRAYGRTLGAERKRS